MNALPRFRGWLTLGLIVSCLSVLPFAQATAARQVSACAGLLKARDNALVSQFEVVGDKIWARYGGNLSTGETDRELELGEKSPDCVADESAGRIFYFNGKDSVVAYQF